MLKRWTPVNSLLMLLSLIFLSIQFSCSLTDVKDIEIAENDREFAISLLSANLSIQEVLEKYITGNELQVDGENFVTIAYESAELTGQSDTLIQIEDFELPVIDTMMNIAPEDFDLENKITKIELKEGLMTYSTQNPFPQAVTVIINFLDVQKSGVPLSFSFLVSEMGEITDEEIDLTNYDLDFSDEFSITYTATFPDGSTTQLPVILLTFKNLDFKYIEGNFEGVSLTLPRDSLFYEIFEGVVEGDFFIEEPTLRIDFSNSYGIPLKLISTLFETSTQNSGILNFETPLSNGFDFAYPSIAERGQFSDSSLDINKNNSNLPQIISALPYRFDYQFDAIAFPDNDSTTIGFVLDDSEFKLNMEFFLPLYGTARGLSFEEVFDFNGDDLEDVKQLELKIVAQNQIPAELGLQLIFENNNGDALQTILDLNDLIFEAALVDADGKSTGAVESERLIPVSASELANIKNAKKVRMRTFISTLNEGTESVRVYTDYELDIQIGMKAILN